jgi:hypothetical protein
LINPTEDTPYSVSVSKGTLGCHATDSVYIQVEDCSVSIADDKDADKNFIVMPNPSNGKIFLQGFEGSKRIIVYDIRGEEVFQTNEQIKSIDLAVLCDGVYLLCADFGKMTIKRKLVLIK